jgi:hypothetical protein
MNAPAAGDRELNAIKAILDALDGLDSDAIQRVLDYVFGRLSISRIPTYTPVQSGIVTGSGVIDLTSGAPSDVAAERVPSIRDLKNAKQPSSANQMAALVAYYLSEVVKGPERKSTVTATDMGKYFKQAGFKLPNRLGMTLPNAAAAGFFDSVGSGEYKLNAVGYNLVAHALPRDSSKSSDKD